MRLLTNREPEINNKHRKSIFHLKWKKERKVEEKLYKKEREKKQI